MPSCHTSLPNQANLRPITLAQNEPALRWQSRQKHHLWPNTWKHPTEVINPDKRLQPGGRPRRHVTLASLIAQNPIAILVTCLNAVPRGVIQEAQMLAGRGNRFRRSLIKQPWLNGGLITQVAPNAAYWQVRSGFESAGFRIAADDDKLKRFCAFRERGQGCCTCLHVVWIRQNGISTYVSYAVEPKHYFFQLCEDGDHIAKLHHCRRIIGSALETSELRFTATQGLINCGQKS